MCLRRRHAERHRNMAVGDLARAARALPLHSDRVLGLFQEARVVDDPCSNRLPQRHRREPMTGSNTMNLTITPRGVRREVQEPLMPHLAFHRAGAHRRRERAADLTEVLHHPLLSANVPFVAHAPRVAGFRPHGKVCDAVMLARSATLHKEKVPHVNHPHRARHVRSD